MKKLIIIILFLMAIFALFKFFKPNKVSFFRIDGEMQVSTAILAIQDNPNEEEIDESKNIEVEAEAKEENSVNLITKEAQEEIKNESLEKVRIFNNFNFSIVTPKDFIPNVEIRTPGLMESVALHNDQYVYVVFDTETWEQNLSDGDYTIKEKKIGNYIYKLYSNDTESIYWLKTSDKGYHFYGGEETLETFKLLN